MIRIDEIYNNIFVPLANLSPGKKSCHWFDPFGSTSIDDICSYPKINIGHRYVFYDQEPLHQESIKQFFDNFVSNFAGNTIVVHSEYNSEDVQWLRHTYSVNDAYYFFHGWAALDWYRGYNRTFLHQPKNIKHTFLCPNNIVGGRRQHRLDLFRELCNRNLIENNLISMPATCPYEGIAVKDYVDCNVELPLQIDDFDNHALNSHRISMWKQASESLVHVVTETSYSGKKNHLTEKTFKPIVLKQPFIIASNRGSLEYLRKYGFETFSSVWDESYDTLPDDQRISAIGNLLQELEHSNCREWLSEQCAPIVQHNYDWFYSGKFEQMLWDELLNMVSKW